jgi:hypothetical protein
VIIDDGGYGMSDKDEGLLMMGDWGLVTSDVSCMMDYGLWLMRFGLWMTDH